MEEGPAAAPPSEKAAARALADGEAEYAVNRALATAAPATTAAEGRVPPTSGPARASTSGTAATATPMTAGSACAVPRTTPMLKITNPVSAMPPSHAHSHPCGRGRRRPVARARTTNSTAAKA